MAVAASGQVMRVKTNTSVSACVLLLLIVILMTIIQPSGADKADESCKTMSATSTMFSVTAHVPITNLYTLLGAVIIENKIQSGTDPREGRGGRRLLAKKSRRHTDQN